MNGDREKYYVLVSIRNDCNEVRELLNFYGFVEEKDYCYYVMNREFFPDSKGYSDMWGNRIIGDLHRAKVKFLGCNSEIEVQEGPCASGLTIVLHTDVRLTLGRNLRIKRGSWYFFDHTACGIGDYCVLTSDNCIYMQESSCMELGCNGRFGEQNRFLLNQNTRVIIGKDALFAKFITIRPGDGHFLYNLETREKYPPKEQIVIHDHAYPWPHQYQRKS